MDHKSFFLGLATGAKASGGGGGGSDITVESLNVTQNGTITAPTGKAYSPVITNVPNTYVAADEGKVVSNGALVAQTAHAKVTQNGTIDTTLNDSVVIDVPQGGGGSSYTLLSSAEYDVSTTSTSASIVGTITLGDAGFTANKIIYVKIRDKAGPRAGYFLGSDCYMIYVNAANGSTGNLSPFVVIEHTYNTSNKYQQFYTASTSAAGVYAATLQWSSRGVLIQKKYSTSSSSPTLTIDGTFSVEVYALDYAPNGNPYNYSYPTT